MVAYSNYFMHRQEMELIMTEKLRFTAALKHEPIVGKVPTFELVFFLTMEAFGKVHPTHRYFEQWNQMTERERELQRIDVVDLYIDIAKKYGHSCIFFHPFRNEFDEIVRALTLLRERSNNEYFIVMHGDSTFAIPNGDDMIEVSARFFEEPEKMHSIAQTNVDHHIENAEKLAKIGGLLDGFCMCSDYCFNTSSFLSPTMFGEFITPYLKRICDEYRSMGFYTIKHTDGNIMPIIDQIVQCGPDALHSLDPQGGVSLSKVKRLYGDKVALCGNVNCALLQTGTEEEAAADVRRSLREGMADGSGYIFSTSNCVYTGLDLSRYEMMINIWKQEGIYK
jgi:uroporphyrinogen decarboxylase